MNPADGYVADFVAGISRLKVVRAHAVMRRLDDFRASGGRAGARAPRVGESETLSALIKLAMENEGAILVERGGVDVGAITRADLLRTVIEGTETS